VLHPVHVHHHAVRVRLWHRLVAIAEPLLHGSDLILLGVGDARGERQQGGTGAV